MLHPFFGFKLSDFMQCPQGKNSMDSVIRAFMEFLLELGWNAIKDSHQLWDAFTVDF